MSDPDPFAVLGLDRSASLDDLRAARRRLAQTHHPDRGGDQAAMQRVNAAFDRAVGHVTGRRLLPPSEPPAAPRQPPRRAAPPTWRLRGTRRERYPNVEVDAPSFTLDVLPVEAFEALSVVASWIGEVLDDDPPYVMECLLEDPYRCWCRLELVPDAGGSTVSLAVAPAAGMAPPTAEAVRDLWVDQLNRLGPPTP